MLRANRQAGKVEKPWKRPWGPRRATRVPRSHPGHASTCLPPVSDTTSVGQEGIDFHWWCHSLVHWNLPANPVDFEQREGRVHRYQGHAVRNNVAADYREAALRSAAVDQWSAAFEVQLAYCPMCVGQETSGAGGSGA